jgi:hypothetical protein
MATGGPGAVAKPTKGAESPCGGDSTEGASKAFGVASAARFAAEDIWTTGRTFGECSWGGGALGRLVAAVASRPVAKAVVIFIAACAIANFLPE